MSENIVELHNITKIFKMGKIDVKALQNVSLNIHKGDSIAFMGPSGSGKTTLLSIIGGLDKPTSGVVKIGGKDITKFKRKSLAKIRLRNIGFIFQFFNLIPTLTAFENIELPLNISHIPKKQRIARVKELLEITRLSKRGNHKPSELSGGEQQRVAIARVLANEPSIILADEPTGNLDSATTKEIINLLKKINQIKNQTVIISTHDSLVANIAKMVLILKDGMIQYK